jgi:hypothetical protein
LLRLLTYCYALGLFSSEAIDACLNPETPDWVHAAEGSVGWLYLRSFRRHHREVLQHALERVAWAAWRWHANGEAAPTLPPPHATEAGPEPDGALAQLIRADATARLNRAAQWDSANLDA